MTPLEHLLKFRNTLLQHRRHLAQLAAEENGLDHAERIQKVQGEIEAIDRAMVERPAITFAAARCHVAAPMPWRLRGT